MVPLNASIPLVLLVLFITFLLIRPKKCKYWQPPSPAKLPIIGNLHQLGALPHRSLRDLSLKHGPLMLVHFGSVPNLVVSSEKSAREIMKTHDLIFSDRPNSKVASELFYHGKDIAFSRYGEYWRQVKKVSVLHLLSPKQVESFRSIREEEVRFMIRNISKSSGPINIGEFFITTTNNIVTRIAFGKTYYEEKKGSGIGFHEMLTELLNLLGTIHIGDLWPSLAWVGSLTGINARLRNSFVEWDRFLENVIEEHQLEHELEHARDTVQHHNNKDFVDVLLDIQKKEELGFPLSSDGIKGILLDIFAAGTDTIYTAMTWAMAEIIKNPRVLNKLQEEIRGVVSGRAEVRELDIDKMLYLKAVLKESFRLHPPLPLLVPRLSTQNVELQGYHIPARTKVIINAWAIGRDPESWEAPDEFWPERFMGNTSFKSSPEIDFKGHDFQLIPFGAGRRGCPGISFTVPTLELALASLLYRFDLEMPGGIIEEAVDMDEMFGITVHKKLPLFLIAKDNIKK